MKVPICRGARQPCASQLVCVTEREPEPLEQFVSRIALEAGVSRSITANAIRDEINAGRIDVDEHGRVIGLTAKARVELAGPLAGLSACDPGELRAGRSS